jgi:hypothetical protein
MSIGSESTISGKNQSFLAVFQRRIDICVQSMIAFAHQKILMSPSQKKGGPG